MKKLTTGSIIALEHEQVNKEYKKKKSKRLLEGYYIDDKGLKILYKKRDGGLSIWT